jgi:predicted lipid-binding transport protein (Tim44 family)
MNRKFRSLISVCFLLCLSLLAIQDAEAKRMGGGRSFGSSPSYSTPYQRSAPSAPEAPNAAPNRPYAQPAPAAAMPQRSGLMGMLGGLAVGGLIGSMLFGGGFSHINFMDFLVFGGIAFLLYRLFAARAPQPATPNAYARNAQASNNGSGFNTDVMFGKQAATYQAPTKIPADFDQTHFLSGAENAFRYLQAAWDKRDLSSIRGLTTDKVFAELQQQLQQSATENKTEVLSLRAELLEVREEGQQLHAVVLFDTVMREDDGPTEQVREVWHFVQTRNSQQSRWFLDGIQQLAA